MTELEWSKEHCPAALKDESDDFILETMHVSYMREIGNDSSVDMLQFDCEMQRQNMRINIYHRGEVVKAYKFDLEPNIQEGTVEVIPTLCAGSANKFLQIMVVWRSTVRTPANRGFCVLVGVNPGGQLFVDRTSLVSAARDLPVNSYNEKTDNVMYKKLQTFRQKEGTH